MGSAGPADALGAGDCPGRLLVERRQQRASVSPLQRLCRALDRPDAGLLGPGGL